MTPGTNWIDQAQRLVEALRGPATTADDAGTAVARLVVGFRPDPQLWPADLLSAEKRTS